MTGVKDSFVYNANLRDKVVLKMIIIFFLLEVKMVPEAGPSRR